MLGDGGPKLIEYNVRFGDPETQAMLPRLQDDLLQLLLACAKGELPQRPIRLCEQAAVTVVMAAEGYPDTPKTGGIIRKLDTLDGVIVTQAGTRLHGHDLVAAGGRVLNVTATGTSVRDARERVYSALAKIDWPDGFYRRDIGIGAMEI